MVGKIDKTPQLNMYQVPFKQFIKDDHELVVLSQKIDWDYPDNELCNYCCLDNGCPGIPIKKISVIMIKRMFNESDENVLLRWVEIRHWQYFYGEVNFQHDLPFDRTELIKFCQQIGE